MKPNQNLPAHLAVLMECYKNIGWCEVRLITSEEVMRRWQRFRDRCVRPESVRGMERYMRRKKIGSRFFNRTRLLRRDQRLGDLLAVSPSDGVRGYVATLDPRASERSEGFDLANGLHLKLGDLFLFVDDSFGELSCGTKTVCLYWSHYSEDILDVTPP